MLFNTMGLRSNYGLLVRIVVISVALLTSSDLSIIYKFWNYYSRYHEVAVTRNATPTTESVNSVNDATSSFSSSSTLLTQHQNLTPFFLNTSDINSSSWASNKSISHVLLMGHYLGMTGGDMALHSLAQVGRKSGATMEFYFPFDASSHNVHPKALKLHSDFQLHFENGNLTQQLNFWNKYDCIVVNTASFEGAYHVFQRLSQEISSKDMDLIYQKLIVWIHEFHTEYSESIEKLMRRAKLLMFCSEAARESWMLPYPWIFEKSWILSPVIADERGSSLLAIPRTSSNGTKDLSRLPQEFRTFSGNSTILLYVGTMSKNKGVPQLIWSFVSFINTSQPFLDSVFHLMLVGKIDGSFRLRKTLVRANRQLQQMTTPSQIIYFPPDTNLLPFYEIADIFVLNSFSETLGMVIMEAMLAGLIVIARDCGGPASLLQNGTTGFLLPNHSPNDDARRVADLSDFLLNLTGANNWKESLLPLRVQARLTAALNFTSSRMASDMDKAFVKAFGRGLASNSTDD
jgi:glycosyltransferase involved in cell wall biosynthesis